MALSNGNTFFEAEETVGIHSSAAIGEDGTIYFGSQHGTSMLLTLMVR